MNGFIVLAGLLVLFGCAGPTDEKETAADRENRTEQAEEESEESDYDLPPHQFIRPGMDVERVKSLVGEPRRIETNEGRPDVWYYSFGLVIVDRETVRYKYPPSPSRVEQPEQR